VRAPATEAYSHRAPVRARRAPWIVFQDLDRLLLLDVLPAQPPELLALRAGQVTRPTLSSIDPVTPDPAAQTLGLTSRATSVIVLSEERANAIASRLNSSEYRFEY
jgi:hypothetical protein